MNAMMLRSISSRCEVSTNLTLRGPRLYSTTVIPLSQRCRSGNHERRSCRDSGRALANTVPSRPSSRIPTHLFSTGRQPSTGPDKSLQKEWLPHEAVQHMNMRMISKALTKGVMSWNVIIHKAIMTVLYSFLRQTFGPDISEIAIAHVLRRLRFQHCSFHVSDDGRLAISINFSDVLPGSLNVDTIKGNIQFPELPKQQHATFDLVKLILINGMRTGATNLTSVEDVMREIHEQGQLLWNPAQASWPLCPSSRNLHSNRMASSEFVTNFKSAAKALRSVASYAGLEPASCANYISNNTPLGGFPLQDPQPNFRKPPVDICRTETHSLSSSEFVKFFASINEIGGERSRIETALVPAVGSLTEPMRFTYRCPNSIFGCKKQYFHETGFAHHVMYCKSTSKEAHLAAERELKNEAEKKTHRCTCCSKAYANRSALSHHISTMHRHFEPKQCSICCGMVYHSRNAYVKHMQDYHGDYIPTTCPIRTCHRSTGKAYISRTLLGKHLRYDHPEITDSTRRKLLDQTRRPRAQEAQNKDNSQAHDDLETEAAS